MKRNYLKQITSLFLLSLLVGFIVISCKKDKLTEPKYTQAQEEQFSDSKTELIVKRIKKFESQLNEFKSGTQRQDYYVDIDSAMWNIEALFNTTFAMPDAKYVDKKIQELTFDIDVHRDNKFSMKEVNVLYDDIIESVRNAYINDGFTENKGLMSIVVDKGGFDTRAAKLKVTLISGRMNNVTNPNPPIEVMVNGPFDFEGCWYFGEYGGTCDDPFAMVDAAELLEDTINYFCGSYSTLNSAGNRNIYVDMTIISLEGDEYMYNGNYRLFYKKNCDSKDLYLTGNDMNIYYFDERNVILSSVPNDPQYKTVLPEDPTFIEVNIDGLSYMEGNDIIYNHHHDILYGTKCEVSKSLFGSAKNILNF